MQTAHCLAGEVTLFCTTAGFQSAAVGCVRDPGGALFWTPSTGTGVPAGWAECTEAEHASVISMQACTR